MEKDILRIDLDKKSFNTAEQTIKERLSYMHDLGFFYIDNIDNIYLIQKTNYSCKIYLNIEIPEYFIIILQLLLGSDYMKEVNTCLNHFKLGMEYSNRMFDIKRYKGGIIKKANHYEITNRVKKYVESSNRKKNNS